MIPEAPSAIASGRNLQGRAEDERERDHHRGEGGGEQHEDLGRELLREALEHDRDAADHIARQRRADAGPAALQLEGRVGDRLAKQRDRLRALRVAEARAQPDRDQGRIRAGRDRRQPRLRLAPRESLVADHRLDVARVVESRRPGLAVLDREFCSLLLEPDQHLLPGRARRRRCALAGSPCFLRLGRRLAGGLWSLDDRPPRLLAEEVVGLDRELVEEGRGAEDDGARLQLGAVMFGPATFLNQFAIEANKLFDQRSKGAIVQARQAASQAALQAKKAGEPASAQRRRRAAGGPAGAGPVRIAAAEPRRSSTGRCSRRASTTPATWNR